MIRFQIDLYGSSPKKKCNFVIEEDLALTIVCTQSGVVVSAKWVEQMFVLSSPPVFRHDCGGWGSNTVAIFVPTPVCE